MKLTLQQLEAHLWGAANIPRGATAGRDNKNYTLSMMLYKHLCGRWGCEADGVHDLGDAKTILFGYGTATPS